MIKSCRKIILTSGTGVGKTKLNAFDKALINAGVGNLNLLAVSSVIPPATKIIYFKNNSKKILPPIGSIVPAVYSSIYSKKIGKKITAMLALGIPKSYRKTNGLIFEVALKDSEIKAKKIGEKMIKEAFRARNRTIEKILFTGKECIVKEKITCVVAVALMI